MKRKFVLIFFISLAVATILVTPAFANDDFEDGGGSYSGSGRFFGGFGRFGSFNGTSRTALRGALSHPPTLVMSFFGNSCSILSCSAENHPICPPEAEYR